MARYEGYSSTKTKTIRIAIFVTFFINCACACLYSISIGTQYWFTSEMINTLDDTSYGNSNFGLFAGVANMQGLSANTKTYQIVCLEGLCMYSSGNSKDERKNSLYNVIHGEVLVPAPLLQEGDEHVTVDNHGKAELSATKYEVALPFIEPPHGKAGNMSEVVPDLMNEGLWIATIISLSAGLLFAVVGAVFAVINTATTPIETLTGIPGLYIWNASAAFFAVLSLILWAVEYHLYMMTNVLIEDQEDGWTTEGFEHLGYSFWLVLVAAFLHTLNCILIFIATYEKKTRTQYEAPETKPGNSMLY